MKGRGYPYSRLTVPAIGPSAHIEYYVTVSVDGERFRLGAESVENKSDHRPIFDVVLTPATAYEIGRVLKGEMGVEL